VTAERGATSGTTSKIELARRLTLLNALGHELPPVKIQVGCNAYEMSSSSQTPFSEDSVRFQSRRPVTSPASRQVHRFLACPSTTSGSRA
jgi:hypothetical protein